VDANTHPDFFTVVRPEDKNEFPTEVMKEFCASFSLKPARGAGKIAIVEDADTLNEESANCFLKTLEEPPPGSVLILVATSAERQLPTIRSRCQAVRFGPLADEQVAAVLRQHEIEDPAVLARLVRLAEGSPGQALALAEPALWDLRKRLLKGLAAARIDTLALGKSFIEFVEDAGKEGALQRRRAALTLKLLVDAFRDALRLGLGAELKSADPEDLRLIRALMDRATPEKIVAALERCLQTEQQIDRYVQLALVLDALLDALSQTLEEGAPAAALR
jgi:DNA polymerase-3 subunit delta'